MGISFYALIALALFQGAQRISADTESTSAEALVGDSLDQKTREVRNNAFWGRLYLRNGIQPIQYFKDQFESNAEIPLEEVKVFLPEDKEGCSAYTENEIQQIQKEPTVVMVNRGTCMFQQKAINAQKAGALAAMLVGDSDDVIRPPGTKEFEGTINMVMIRKSAGKI